MSRRASLFAAVLLTFPLAGPTVSPAAASEILVVGPSCTITHTPGESEEMLALAGVFAATWSAEILRDVPAARDDMAMARSWHADKTTTQVESMPEAVREAMARINVAGQRVGYEGEEATAPLRILVQRNDHRAAERGWHAVTPESARRQLAAAGAGGAPTALSFSRENLSVAAEESWTRAWNRTPGAQAEAEASRAELALCAAETSGSVNRATAARNTDVPEARLPLTGVPVGELHASMLMSLLEEAAGLKNLFR